MKTLQKAQIDKRAYLSWDGCLESVVIKGTGFHFEESDDMKGLPHFYTRTQNTSGNTLDEEQRTCSSDSPDCRSTMEWSR